MNFMSPRIWQKPLPKPGSIGGVGVFALSEMTRWSRSNAIAAIAYVFKNVIADDKR